MDLVPGGPSTLFGVSRGVERSLRDRYLVTLGNAWYAFAERPIQELERDLDMLKPFFKSAASGKSVRHMIDTLHPTLAGETVSLPETVLIQVDDEHALITPEGRVLLEVMERLRSRDSEVISLDEVAWATEVVATTYGGWQREWLVKLVQGGDLRPATFASALFLLINNNTGPGSPLRLPADEEGQRALASVLVPVFNEFVDGVGATPLSMDTRLQSHWAMTELSRQLPQQIARRRGDDGATLLFTKVGTEEALAVRLGELLAARRSLGFADLEEALARLVSEYRRARPSLAAWGLAHEKPARTKRLLSSLEKSFERARVAEL